MFRVLFTFTLLAALAGSSVPGEAQDLFRSIFGPSRWQRDWPQRWQRMPPPPGQALPPAQQGKAAPKEAAKVETVPPPYDGEMSRLAEILGALHYLRPLCGADDGARWRGEMQNLIEAEQPPPDRRDRMIASFNRSYVAYEYSYRSCTPAASLAIRRYLDEGVRLSREIATKYGN
jgi:uncharacterized protein (TIGR02301 family)